jgi:cell division protein FtsB
LQVRLANLGPQAQDSLVKATVAEAIPLTLQTRLEKARMNSFELMAHLQSQSRKHKDSLAHYEEITRNMTTVDDRIASLKAASSLEALEQALTAITNDIVPLTKQTPFTLLMMRVVEIGLPVLLSLVSLYFLFQYSLTEKLSHEIKDLLKQRNEARSKEAHDAPGAMTV